jgi:hypothetical protein
MPTSWTGDFRENFDRLMVHKLESTTRKNGRNDWLGQAEEKLFSTR